MNRTKYRVWLISIVLMAVIFGIFYYTFMEKQENTITDGTLVYHIERVPSLDRMRLCQETADGEELSA